MGREDPQLKLRLSEQMKERITDEARSNGRSVNAEIVSRLEQSFSDQRSEGKNVVRLLLQVLDAPADDEYRQAVEAWALFYFVNAPAADLDAALRLANAIHRQRTGKDRDHAGETIAILKRMEAALDPKLRSVADYMRAYGWEVTPPEELPQ